jgi:imidazolonepropionase-like amidohydrolase
MDDDALMGKRRRHLTLTLEARSVFCQLKEDYMRTVKLLSYWLLVAVTCSLQAATQTPTTKTVTLFEGARLIVGDESPPIENSAFLVENNKFTRVGKKGDLQAPSGATRVDLTGKTVMPALVELHAHVGYWKGPSNTNLVENFTRENILDHLQRFAYHGVAAILSLGTDRRELAYQVRDELRKAPPRDTALYFTAGQGLSSPNAGPGFPMRPAVYEVTTEAQARSAVQEMVSKKVDRFLKIWHDANRGKLPPAIYQAIIDEAHTHNLRLMSHVDVTGQKELVRAGLDGFAHAVWRDEVDDELITLLKQHPKVFTLTTFWGARNQMYGARPSWLDDPLLRETFTPDEIQRLENPKTPPDAPQQWAAGPVPRNVAKLKAAGVRMGIGGDIGGISGGGGYFGWSSHIEMASLVKAGLTPAEAITVATHNSAEIFGLDDLGTVATGKSADFIVLNANPLDDIANTRRINKVYLRGNEVNRAALRAKWTGQSSSR